MNYYVYVPCCPVIFPYQTPHHEQWNSYPVNMYYAYPPYFDYRFYPVPANPMNYYLERGYRGCEDAARINAAMDYVTNNFQNQGFDGGFPNFEEARKNGELVYGIVFIRPNAYLFHHALPAEFGNIDRTNVEAMMQAAHEYSKSKGYVTGFPTFHKGPNDYGVLSFKEEAIEQKNIPATTLGNPNTQNIRDFFIAVNRFALQEGYAAAFPTFVRVIEPGGILHHKVAFIKRGYAEIRDALAKNLDLPKYLASFGCSPGPIIDGPSDTTIKRFPIKGNQHTELGSHRRMATDLTISKNGRIDIVTKTWTSAAFQGFTGTVVVFLKDIDGNIIHATVPQRYGVSGVRVGAHTRTDTYTETIPVDLVNQTTTYAILHSVTPINRITPSEFKKWVDTIEPLVKAYVESQSGQ